METAGEVVARTLPPILFIGGSETPFVSPHRISVTLLHLWSTFQDEVLTALRDLDLSGPVSRTDAPEGEQFLVRNELGLSGRFVQMSASLLGRLFGLFHHFPICVLGTFSQ